jgi:hypothetical protein
MITTPISWQRLQASEEQRTSRVAVVATSCSSAVSGAVGGPPTTGANIIADNPSPPRMCFGYV